MALSTLDDAQFVAIAVNHLNSIRSQHNSQSENIAREYFTKKNWIADNVTRVRSVLGTTVFNEYNAEIDAIGTSLTKLYEGGLQSRTLAEIGTSVADRRL